MAKTKEYAEANAVVRRHLEQLVGKRIVAVVEDMGEPDPQVFGLALSDGSTAWIQCDPEGNGPGHLDIQR